MHFVFSSSSPFVAHTAAPGLCIFFLIGTVTKDTTTSIFAVTLTVTEGTASSPFAVTGTETEGVAP